MTPKSTTRRKLLKGLGLGAAAGLLGMHPDANARTENVKPAALNGLPPLKITNVKAIGTAPSGSNLIVVKVETSEPGLYGLGCATFTQRAFAVITAIEKYLQDFCIGKDVDNIEDMWQSAFVSSYWRNGPVLNNAISGLDQALWDIKGKRANMPVYQLLGGKSRFAVPCYTHASGNTPEAAADQVSGYMEEGYRYVRIQQGGYGGTGLTGEPDFKNKATAGKPTNIWTRENTSAMSQSFLKPFAANVEKRWNCYTISMKDWSPWMPSGWSKAPNPTILFSSRTPFLRSRWNGLKALREATTVPLAMGELFNNINEFKEPITNRLFDYIRIHISQIGGISPAMKVARLGEFYGVKTAWHGPGDVSPVGHAANAHIDLAIWNFGIQEAARISDLSREIFPGSPVMKDGYMWVNEAPGLGVDINEDLAKKYPMHTRSNWTVRKFDGTIIRP